MRKLLAPFKSDNIQSSDVNYLLQPVSHWCFITSDSIEVIFELGQADEAYCVRNFWAILFVMSGFSLKIQV